VIGAAVPSLDSLLLKIEVLILALAAVFEFLSLLRWRRRIRPARRRGRLLLGLYAFSDLLVGAALLLLIPLVYSATWVGLFGAYPLVASLILLIALLLLTAGAGKALLLVFTRSHLSNQEKKATHCTGC
jgi:hypothetical protein